MELFEVTNIGMHAIGKTIVHSLWIGMLILALLRIVLAHIPARLSGLRYRLSVSSLFLLFFSVITAFLLIYEPASSGQDLFSIKGIIAFGPGNKQIPNMGATPNKYIFLFTLFGYIYFAGVLFMLVRSVRSLAQIKEIQKSGIKPGEDWQARFFQLCKGLGIKRPVAFLESKHVKGPILVAYLKPAVIVPAGMLTHLPVHQIETILMHELYHLKRKDYLINLMQLIIEGVLFYHPVAWLISGFIRSEREHCCDDQVLSSTNNPIDYAKALIHIAEHQQFTRLAPGAVGANKHQFYTRIKRILNHNTMKTNMRDKVLTLTLLAGSLILLLTISGFSAAPSFIKNKTLNTQIVAPAPGPVQIAVPDTIPEKSQEAELEEIQEPDWEEMKEELEEARLEALKEIEEIDWEAIKEEVEEARLEALQDIEEIDWDALKEEMEEARLEALQEIEEIDWEELRADMEHSFSEIKLDIEEMKIEIQNSFDEIDWDEIREQIEEDMEEVRILLDSMKIEMDL